MGQRTSRNTITTVPMESQGQSNATVNRVGRWNRDNILLCMTVTGTVLAILATVMSVFLMVSVTVLRKHQVLTRQKFEVAIDKAKITCGTNLETTKVMATQGELIQSLHFNLAQDKQNTKEKLAAHENKFRVLEANYNQLSSGTGSTYTRWGRPECPGNGTDLVYSGFVGGGHYHKPGSAVNYLCLTKKPTWNHTVTIISSADLFGAEYELTKSYGNMQYFSQSLYNHEPPCAVCRSTRASVVMIPGTNLCTEGWTEEYAGYLVAGGRDDVAASEYICLDSRATIAENSSSTNLDAKWLRLVKAQCGSLMCPPYIDEREVTCVVCTR